MSEPVVHCIQLITSKEWAKLCEEKLLESRDIVYLFTYVSAGPRIIPRK